MNSSFDGEESDQAAGPAPACGGGVLFRRPLAGICLGAVAGWLAGFYVTLSPVVALFAAAVLLFATFVRARRASSTWTLHVAVMLAALAHAGMCVNPPSPADVGNLLQRQRESVEMVGTIADKPELRDASLWVFPLNVEGLRVEDSWQRGRGVVEVRWPVMTNAAAPVYGGRWYFAGPVTRLPPHGSAALYRMKARREAYRLGEGGRSEFYAWCLRQRERAAAMLGRGMREQDFPRELSMMRALILGERSDMDDAVRNAFARTGTLHIVAISGSHVAVFLGFITAVLKMLGCPRTRWVLYAAPVLIIYTVATGMSSSAVRACIMSIAFIAAPLFRRRTDAATALSLATLLILPFAPRDIFDAGFLLSFLVVGGMMLFYGPVMKIVAGWIPGDPWQIQFSAVTKILRMFWRSVASLASASISAWLVSAPLTAIFFNLCSPVALLANLFVVPLASLILISGTLSLVVGGFSPFAGEVFNHAARVFIHAMLWIVQRAEEIPLAYQFVRAPAIPWVILYYALLTALFFARGKLRTTAAAVSATLILALAADYFLNRRVTLEWTRIGTTPVLFVDAPRQHDVLINTGEAYYEPQLVRLLRHRGVDRLDALVLTRPSGEALGGALALLDEIPADEIWISPWHGRSKISDAFLEGCKKRNLTPKIIERGNGGELAAGLRWTAFHPHPLNTYRSAAEGGLVLRFEREGGSFLFAGGSGTACEKEITGWRNDIAADVLIAGVKTKQNWSDEFTGAVNPRAMIVPQPAAVSDAAAANEQIPSRPGTAVITIRRDELWRAALPDAQHPLRGFHPLLRFRPPPAFQSLEKGTGSSSNLWNRSGGGGGWWEGEVSGADVF